MPTHWSQYAYRSAYLFAASAHRGQPFPGTDLPYIVHLAFVSMEVMAALQFESHGRGDLAIQCALLHDVLEDTPTELSAVNAEFGDEVGQGVLALTKNAKLEKGLRMRDSLQRIRQRPPEVWMVKLADRIANLERPPSDWSKHKIASYRDEAGEIHTALETASPYLAGRLRQKIEAYAQYM